MTNWKNIKEGTLLIVTWEDILDVSGWLTDKEALNMKPTRCEVVGWFIGSDKYNIRLTDMVAEDGDKSVIILPKGCVRKVQRIKHK
jgi:hypothetical protein